MDAQAGGGYALLSVTPKPDGSRTTFALPGAQQEVVSEQELLRELRHALSPRMPGLDGRVLVLLGLGHQQLPGQHQEGHFPPPAHLAQLAAICRRLEELPRPVVGMVDGHVCGLHMGLLLACDLAIAAEGSTFAYAQARTGAFPSLGITRGADLIGRRNAGYLALTGLTLDTAQARALGLVNVVVPHRRLSVRVDELVENLNRRPPRGLAVAKRMLTKWAHRHYVAAEEAGGVGWSESGG